MIDAEVAQPADPGDDRGRRKAPLGHDMYAEPGLSCRFELGRERAVEVVGGEPGMAVGIAGNADLDDAAGLQQAALDHFDRGMERTGRRREIAADDEDAPHLGLFGQPGEMGIEGGAAGKAAHREMRDRLEARRGEPAGDVDLRGGRPRRHRADIDPPARRKAAQGVEIAAGEARHLEGGLRREGGDALPRVRRGGERECGGSGHVRADLTAACDPMRIARSGAAARDHIGFIVEPQPAMLAQHVAGGVEIAAVADDGGEPVVLDLGHIDRRVPRRK